MAELLKEWPIFCAFSPKGLHKKVAGFFFEILIHCLCGVTAGVCLSPRDLVSHDLACPGDPVTATFGTNAHHSYVNL